MIEFRALKAVSPEKLAEALNEIMQKYEVKVHGYSSSKIDPGGFHNHEYTALISVYTLSFNGKMSDKPEFYIQNAQCGALVPILTKQIEHVTCEKCKRRAQNK